MLGDSSVWGTLLKPEETLAGQINALHLQTCDGRTVRAYNLGYPTLSVTKDLMILDEARQVRAGCGLVAGDAGGVAAEKQLTSPLAANNPARLDALAESTGVVDPADPAIIRPDFWGRTILGQRRPLADLLRLQLYGVMWSATGIDQFYPAEYPPAAIDLDADESFHDRQPPTLDETSLSLDVLDAGAKLLGDVPLTVINEPILISDGQNSDLRYNFFYPRWAYDQYRALLAEQAASGGWTWSTAGTCCPDRVHQQRHPPDPAGQHRPGRIAGRAGGLRKVIRCSKFAWHRLKILMQLWPLTIWPNRKRTGSLHPPGGGAGCLLCGRAEASCWVMPCWSTPSSNRVLFRCCMCGRITGAAGWGRLLMQPPGESLPHPQVVHLHQPLQPADASPAGAPGLPSERRYP